MDNNEAKQVIEELYKHQIAEVQFPCPRCGDDCMDEKPVRNALSRHAKVFICNKCGMDEAMRDMTGNVLPLKDWSFVKND